MSLLGKVRYAAGATCAAVVAAGFGGTDGAARAQATDASAGAGFVAALTLTPQVVLSDRDGEGLTPRLGFALSLSDITKSQALTLEATGGLQRSLGGGGVARNSSFDRPSLRAGYLYETRETAIGFDLSYSRSDIDDSFADPLTGFLILDSGTQTNLSLGTNVEFGRESPIGGTFVARRSYRVFDGTTDLRFQDAVIDDVALSTIFRVDPRIDVTAGVSYRNVDADDPGTDLRDLGGRIGVSAAATQTLTVDAGIGYNRTERSGGLRTSRTEQGAGFDVGLSQDRPNGALTARLSSGISESGRRTRLDVGRSLELRDGALSFGAGLVRSAGGGGFDPLYSFAYSKAMPLSELSAAFQQSYVTDIDGDEAINSTLSLGYTRQIGPLDQIRASYVLQDSTIQSGLGDDATRSEFGLTYSRTVTRDWSLVAGYTHDRDEGGAGDTDAENEVFLGIERTFTWRN